MITKSVSWAADKVNIPGIAYNRYDSETAFQIYCADWLRKQYQLTGWAGYNHWHHSANERAGVGAGFTAKMMGQSKGWPDFVCPGLMLAIELKLPGRLASRWQVEWLEHFAAIGWDSELVWTFERFVAIVEGKRRDDRRKKARASG